jgi:LacI family transcriptional regulator
MSEKRVTISDIARESGASPTTVSLVLRDKGVIGAETRERVLAAAQQLGYSRKASRPTKDQVATVAILFRAHTPNPHGRAPLGVNPFYSWVLTGMEAVARTKRMNLLYGTLAVNDSNGIVDKPDHLLGQDLSGVIVIGAFCESAITAMFASEHRPLVIVDGAGGTSHHDVIASDNTRGAQLAVEHLIQAGHRRIGLISRLKGSNPNFEERERGYLKAMQEAGLQPVVGRIEAWSVDAAIEQVFAEAPDTTALFCVNDHFAQDVWKLMEARGRLVPKTLSIVGFDNTDHAVATSQGLTTMHVDKVGMGRLAITLLDYRLQWPEAAPASVMLTPSLIPRGSVAPPPTKLVNYRQPSSREQREAIS